ncbi:MAG: ankyrin repeat domain-containing protein [Desulfobacterales bacterium]|nr:ankyrin repeat domain-containing protein [Desulfobacterales bacterium]
MNNQNELEWLKDILSSINEFPDFCSNEMIDVNHVSTLGDTPLHVASVWGDVKIVDLLIKNGARLDAKGEEGNTPLHEAVSQGHHEIVQFLLKAGCSTTIKNDGNLTAQQLADLLRL